MASSSSAIGKGGAQIGAFGLPLREGLAEELGGGSRVLQVQVVSGEKLPPKDRSGTSDPYVTLWIDNQKKRKYVTAVKRATLSPVWEYERWTVRLPQNANQLYLKVKAHDVGKKSDFMGMASLDLNKGGFNEAPVRIAVELKDRKMRAGKNLGFLKLNVAIKHSAPPLQSSHKFSQTATETLFRGLVQRNFTAVHEFFQSPASAEANYNCVCAAKRTKGAEGLTPLMLALSHHEPAVRLQTIHVLLEKGASVSFRVEGTGHARLDQLTPVYYAATLGLPAELDVLLNANPELSHPDHAAHCLLDGNSPLMGAIFWNHFKTMKTLLTRGASPNHRNETGVTPLIIAAHLNRSLDYVETLVKAGAELNARSDNGSTALYEYARCGNLKAVEYLLSLGAVNSLHSSGLTPLLAAMSKGYTGVAMALIPSTARDKLLDVFVHHTNAFGTIKVNALTLAALSLKKVLVRVLVENGASPEGSMFIGQGEKQTTHLVSTVVQGLGFGEYLVHSQT